MKLYFKQRFFSWFDSYDIYDYDTGDVVYTVEGQLAWGHCLHILDADGRDGLCALMVVLAIDAEKCSHNS